MTALRFGIVLGMAYITAVRRVAQAGAVWIGSTQQPGSALQEQANVYDASLSAGCVSSARPVLRNLIADGNGAAQTQLAAVRDYYWTLESWGLRDRFGSSTEAEEERLASVLIHGEAEKCTYQNVKLAKALHRDSFFMKMHWSGIESAALLRAIRFLGEDIALLANKLYQQTSCADG